MQPLSDIARLDVVVTVVDSSSFLHDINSSHEVRERDTTSSDDRSIAPLLVDQIEWANIVILNKIGLVEQESERLLIVNTVKGLNANAKIVQCNHSSVKMEDVMFTNMFSLTESQQRADWMSVPRGMEKSESDEYDIKSFTYQRNRPFHPERLNTHVLSSMPKFHIH